LLDCDGGLYDSNVHNVYVDVNDSIKVSDECISSIGGRWVDGWIVSEWNGINSALVLRPSEGLAAAAGHTAVIKTLVHLDRREGAGDVWPGGASFGQGVRELCSPRGS